MRHPRKLSIARNPGSANRVAYAATTLGLAGALATAIAGCAEVDMIEGEPPPVVAPPVAVLKSMPAKVMRLKSAVFEFEGEGATAFLCTLDGSTPQPCTSPYTTPQLADGSHAFAVAAQDAEGRTQQNPEPYLWQIDSTMQGIAFSNNLPAYVNTPAVTFTFSSNESDLAYTCQLDGAAAVDATPVGGPNGQGQFQCAYTVAADGDHEIVVTGSNQIGSQTASQAWVLDRVIPIFTKGAEVKNAVVGKYELNYVVSEYAASGACTVIWQGANNTLLSAPVSCGLAAGNTSGKVMVTRSTAFPACRDFVININFTDRAGNQLAIANRYQTAFVFDNANGTACSTEQAPQGPGGQS